MIFTQDPNQSDCASLEGDILCAFAAVFYATYDLRLLHWGKLVPTNELITTKMVTQSLLALGMLSVFGRQESLSFLSDSSAEDLKLVGLVALWSGLAVNCVAPYLQVSVSPISPFPRHRLCVCLYIKPLPPSSFSASRF